MTRYVQKSVETDPWYRDLTEASLYVLVPSGFLFYGLYAMAAGWGMTPSLVGLACYGLGWVGALMRINS